MLENGRKMDTSMETSFYPDDVFLLKEKMRGMKRPMTLDLDSGAAANGTTVTSKRPKFSLLSSPDLNMLKLASPELESLLIQHNGQVTTTPTPTQFIFPKDVTEEQEMYARGFVDALAELHTSNPGLESSKAAPHSSTSGTTYTTFTPAMTHILIQQQQQQYPSTSTTASTNNNNVFLPVSIKEEPQTVPNVCSTPPMSPIDMMAQERIKLERKRQRNRVAASKCRRRKLERIARLEDKVKLLKNENSELGTVVTKLKDHICGLKQQLLQHLDSGCQIMTPAQYLS